MIPVSAPRHALLGLLPLSLVLSFYLYLYPVFHKCAFPSRGNDASTAYANTLREHSFFSAPNTSMVAPFRLLALGDPQLEGDSSIPDPQAATFPNLAKFWKDALLLDGIEHTPLQRLRHSLHDLVDFYLDDIPKALEVWRKRLDHVGNDYYLGHIYRTLHWWTKPTHVTVLGDLVGSQWIGDEEFESRGWRFWQRVFRGGERVPDEIASPPIYDVRDTRVLGDNADEWTRRIINVAGNHDIGYAGDLSAERMTRFERVFGKANYELRFQLPIKLTQNITSQVEGDSGQKPGPELRIVVLNDMNLDTPASSKDLQDETYQFLNDIISTSQDVTRKAHFTLVLTHIPMHKKEGICFDGPFFDFFSGDFENGVKEQNHLSADASKGFLEGIFGMSGRPEAAGQGLGRKGLILTGHDHEGCDIYHYINQSADMGDRQWEARPWSKAKASGLLDEAGIPGLREITVRSMMGEFSGNAGLLSLWFDEEIWDWRFEFAECRMGKQHIWWVVHVLDLITLGVGLSSAVMSLIRKFQSMSAKPKRTSDGKANSQAPKIKLEDDKIDANILEHVKTNGKLSVPGAGKKSLRKKKSKRALDGSGTHGSATSGT